MTTEAIDALVVNFLLERFDQTEPALQRQIVAQIAADRLALSDALHGLVDVIADTDLRKYPSSMRLVGIVSDQKTFAALDAARKLLAEKE